MTRRKKSIKATANKRIKKSTRNKAFSPESTCTEEDEIKIELGNSPDTSGHVALLLFTSFDLVGSTSLKEEQTSWANLIHRFYKDAAEQLKNKNFRLWKLSGDETIFFSQIAVQKVETKKDGALSVAVDKPADILSKISSSVTHIYQALGKLSTVLRKDCLDVKGAAWLLYVDNITNLVFQIEQMANEALGIKEILECETTKLDFIGPSMDEGFRVAHVFARPRRLALSFDLAYCLVKSKDTQNRVKQVGFENLKGVWKNRLYPGFWFFDNFKDAKDDTPFDAETICKFTKEFCNATEPATSSKLFESIQESVKLAQWLKIAELLNL